MKQTNKKISEMKCLGWRKENHIRNKIENGKWIVPETTKNKLDAIHSLCVKRQKKRKEIGITICICEI